MCLDGVTLLDGVPVGDVTLVGSYEVSCGIFPRWGVAGHDHRYQWHMRVDLAPEKYMEGRRMWENGPSKNRRMHGGARRDHFVLVAIKLRFTTGPALRVGIEVDL